MTAVSSFCSYLLDAQAASSSCAIGIALRDGIKSADIGFSNNSGAVYLRPESPIMLRALLSFGASHVGAETFFARRPELLPLVFTSFRQ